MGAFLAVPVLVMGWSWAPFLANAALGALLSDIHGELTHPIDKSRVAGLLDIGIVTRSDGFGFLG